ncbi:MAG: DISARM system helicase DrmA, partial [Ktedonobacteraceae bacterium]
MDVIILPPHLADEPNLTAINQRLLTGEATLDWSQVKQASLEELRVLLANMDLVEHSDFLGIDSVPGDLAELVLQAIAPEVWETEPEVEQDTGNGEVSPYLCKGRSGVERGGDPRGRPGEEWRPGNEPDDGSALSSGRQPGSPILRPPSPSAIRDELERLVLLDLLGPAGGPEEEVEDSSVRDRYLVGALAPSELQTTPEEMDELAIPDDGAGEDSASDEGVMQIATLFPSSLGFSFCVDDAATSLSVTAAWGCYRREHSATLKTPKGTPRMVWKRRQMGEETRLFPLKAGPIPSWSPEPFEQPDVVVRGLMRWLDGSWTVTLFLVNEQHEPEKNRDQAWIFQPELIVEAPDGAPIFQRRDALKRNNHTDEEVAMAMLYRRHVGFAIGHGISVHAETLPGDSTRAVRLSACVVPTYDVPRTESPTPIEIPGLVGLVLDMKELAETPVEKMSRTLMPLVTVYEGWIAQQATRIDDPANDPAEYRPVALQSMQECRRTLERIRDGITLLAQKGHAAKAFAFMNEAMWQQRIHTLHAEQKRRGQHNTLEDIDKPENRSWRPFQLAFILLNLPALTDLHHPDRSADASAIADLLWFPTGGGKTEAYLGLTAFTLAIRRLQGIVEGRSGEDGVAVIMRYTLRLLTLQQFQRAAALMCACEVIRQNDPQRTWGTTPFRLGLWVGQRTTPNTTEQSEESSKQDRGVFQRGSTIGGVGSPRQLTNCPWCGSPIEAGRDIKIELYPKGRGRTFIYCGDQLGRCPFSRRNAPEGLPVLVVDEEIYRCLPSLLIATVDKFAQMPWNGNTQMLFGQVNKKCTRHGFRSPDLEDKDFHRAEGGFPHARSFPHAPLRPPDLIIQDELHLISGPLGSLVGLYETVVDGLSTWEVDGKLVRPKVVAATATIRRAAQQVHALFMRQVNVFPPQGLDVEDNFFARQREPADETPGRRYIGICASGRRLKAALIRVYVAYLSAGQYLYDKYGRAADPWMTLVGYFNSINELGGTRRLVEDDVRSRLQRMDQRGLAKRNTPFMEELTSRKSSTDIPDVLDRLEQVFDPNQQKQDGSPRRIDVLLATNMISVGVDVKRLGLMVVTGQPKTTAEYIQATSRVGRNAPGLVCVVFNWARPRDLSQYEQFEHYHAAFYQQVEALSVTPFAPRALDRGLSALLVSFVRLLGPEFNANESAGIVDGTYPYFVEAFNDIYRRA